MGISITIIAESRDDTGSFAGTHVVFTDDEHDADENELASTVLDALLVRNFDRYAFLAGQTNNAGIRPISPPRGLPEDASLIARELSSLMGTDAWGRSWLTIDELMAFDYDQPLRFLDGFCPATNLPAKAAGTYRQMLGDEMILAVRELKARRFERLVIWFDG